MSLPSVFAFAFSFPERFANKDTGCSAQRGAIHRREERRVACCRISRRHIQEAGVCLLGGAVLSLVREEQAWATEAATTESQVYSDKRTSFQIVPPADWTYGENEDPRTGKRIVGFYPVDKSLANTSVTVTASFSAADYTSMGSFGSPYGAILRD